MVCKNWDPELYFCSSKKRTINPDELEDANYNLPTAKRKELLSLMLDCGVVAVLGGHKHQTIINNYKGIQLVNSAAISKNDDGSPLGFRIWKVSSPKLITHEFVPLSSQDSKKLQGANQMQ